MTASKEFQKKSHRHQRAVVAFALVAFGGLGLTGCRTLAAAADPMQAPECRVFAKGAGQGQVVVEGVDAYASSLGIRRHVAQLRGGDLVLDTPLGGRQTGRFDGDKIWIDTGLTTVTSEPITAEGVLLKGARYQKRFLFNDKCSVAQAAVGAYALFELSRRRQRY